MLKLSRRSAIGLLVGLCLVIATVCFFLLKRCDRFNPDNTVIRLHDGQRDSMHMNNAIARYIIEHGYGYRVETVAESTYDMQRAIEKGRIDANLEFRRQDCPNWYESRIRTGKILNLGLIFQGGAQFFMIPRQVADKHNIRTVFDMKDHWQLFRDPADPSKGLFHNGTVGWGSHDINVVKLEAYGLTKYYNLLSAPSGEALDATLGDAQEQGEPVFGYYWAPNALLGKYEWHILEEPEHSETCWVHTIEATDDPKLRPLASSCAYRVMPAVKLIHKGLIRKAPEVVDMLKGMVTGEDRVNVLLAKTELDEKPDWEKVALEFLETDELFWSAWVTPQAYGKIKIALKQRRAGPEE